MAYHGVWGINKTWVGDDSEKYVWYGLSAWFVSMSIASGFFEGLSHFMGWR